MARYNLIIEATCPLVDYLKIGYWVGFEQTTPATNNQRQHSFRIILIAGSPIVAQFHNGVDLPKPFGQINRLTRHKVLHESLAVKKTLYFSWNGEIW